MMMSRECSKGDSSMGFDHEARAEEQMEQSVNFLAPREKCPPYHSSASSSLFKLLINLNVGHSAVH